MSRAPAAASAWPGRARAPDGYTLVIGHWSTHVGARRDVLAAVRRAEGFRAGLADRRYAALIVGRSTLPAKDLKELIAWLKANPGKATAGTVGVGSAASTCAASISAT